MRLTSGTVFALRIPFTEAFRHSSKDRESSDAVVVRVAAGNGVEGFGEGLGRAYVTGETVDSMIATITHDIWPKIAYRELPGAEDGLDAIEAFLADPTAGPVVAHHASRAAVELAIVDCVFSAAGLSLSSALPPMASAVPYSGVISATTVEHTRQIAAQMRLMGLKAVKIKVGVGDDVARVACAREVLGDGVSIRVDANGGWTPDEALTTLAALVPYGVVFVEQPIPRCAVEEMARFRAASPIPVMADESLITQADLEALIAANAVDAVNIRISKCGGLARSAAMARRALEAGLVVQIGCQVGETAILSAAGRHLAAALPGLAFVEGSFGSLLLTEDLSVDPVRFGHGGRAPILKAPGLGVRVRPDLLEKYAVRKVDSKCS